MNNQVIDAITNRRSIRRFMREPVSEEHVSAILESGRWAPSWLNIQPCKFIVIDDTEIQERLCTAVPTLEKAGVREAPLCIAVCVEDYQGSAHAIEDAAAATQNMSIAAHSLGLGTYWVGVLDRTNGRKSSETLLKKILRIPEDYRLVSLLPVGVPEKVPVSNRKNLDEIVSYNVFSFAQKSRDLESEHILRMKIEDEEMVSFSTDVWQTIANGPKKRIR